MAERLRDKKFDVFLDRSEFAAGDDWKKEGMHALRHTQRLIVVATREALTESDPVEIEVENFSRLGRHIIEIVFDDSLNAIDRSTNRVLRHIPEPTRLYVKEDPENLARGPSLDEPRVLNTIAITHTVLRRRVLRARIIAGVIGTLMVAVLTVALLWQLAEARRLWAEQRTRVATAQRLAAQSNSVREDRPQCSLLLAAEAIEALKPSDPRVSDGVQNLQDAIGSVGGHSLRGHGPGSVNRVAMSDDGRWLASAGADQKVALWKIEHSIENAKLVTLVGHTGPVTSVAFARERPLLVSVSENEVWLWDLLPREAAPHGALLVGNCGRVLRVTLTKEWLAVGSGDGKVRLWTLSDPAPESTGKILGDLGSAVHDIEITRDGRWVAASAASPDVTIFTTAANLGTEKHTTLTHGVEVEKLAASRDDRWLATTTTNGMVTLWPHPAGADAADGVSPVMEFVIDEFKQVHEVVFSPDSRWLAVACTQGERAVLHLWTVASVGRRHFQLDYPDQGVDFLKFSPGSGWLAVGSVFEDPHVWKMTVDGPSGNPFILRGHRQLRQVTNAIGPMNSLFRGVKFRRDGIRCLEFTSDDKGIITGGGSSDYTARYWPLDEENPLENASIWRAHEGPILSISVCEKTHTAATSSEDGSVRVWPLDRTQVPVLPRTLRVPDAMFVDLFFSANNRWLVGSSRGGLIYAWSCLGGFPVLPGEACLRPDHVVRWISWSPDRRWLVVARPGGSMPLLVDLSRDDPFGSTLPVSDRDEPSFHAAFTPESRTLVTRRASGDWQAWDLSQDMVTARPVFLPIPDPALDCKFIATARERGEPGTLVVVAGFEQVGLLSWLVPVDAHAGIPSPTSGDSADFLGASLTDDGAFCLAQGTKSSSVIWRPAHADSRVIERPRSNALMSGPSRDAAWFAEASLEGPVRLFDFRRRSTRRDSSGCLLGSESTDDQAENAFSFLRNPLTLTGHREQVSCWSFSHDGRWMATGDRRGDIRVWDLWSGRTEPSSQLFVGHEDKILSVAFGPFDRWLASTSQDRMARVWGLNRDSRGAERLIFRAGSPARCAALSPDGRWLANTVRHRICALH